MNIAYINVIEQNQGWGAEYFINRGLIKNGHETQCIDYRVHRKSLAKDLKTLSDFDIFFLQRAEYLPIELIEAIKAPKIYWATELIKRRREQDELIRSGLFDHVFLHSQVCKDIVIEKRWIEKEKVSVLINGFDEELHVPDLTIKKDIDILFLGNITPRRKKIIEKLKRLFPIEIRKAYGKEMVHLFNRSKIVLNIHASKELDTETRVFEALGCGAFILSEPLSKENPFIPNVHYAESSIEDFPAVISYYLDNEKDRLKIAESGSKEAWEKHSYQKRAEQIASVMYKFLNTKIDSSLDKQYLDEQFDWVKHPHISFRKLKYIQKLYYPTANLLKKFLYRLLIALKIIFKGHV